MDISAAPQHYADMNKSIQELVIELRERLDLNQTELAEKVHVTQAAVSRWETGSIPARDTLAKLADLDTVNSPDTWLGLSYHKSSVETGAANRSKRAVADIDQKQLASEPGRRDASLYDPLTESVYLIGQVQAGAWMEAYQLPESDWKEMPQSADPRFPGIQRYALKNVGESMNDVCPDGGTWTFVRFDDLIGQGPQPGNFVIVERHRDGLVEATCKQFRLDANGRPRLYPCSDDPSFEPISLDEGDPEYEKIIIIGRVTQVSALK